MLECCKVGYLATLARAHVYNVTCSGKGSLSLPMDLCREFI